MLADRSESGSDIMAKAYRPLAVNNSYRNKNALLDTALLSATGAFVLSVPGAERSPLQRVVPLVARRRVGACARRLVDERW